MNDRTRENIIKEKERENKQKEAPKEEAVDGSRAWREALVQEVPLHCERKKRKRVSMVPKN